MSTTSTARPSTQPSAQPAARYGFLAFCLAAGVVDVLWLDLVTGSSSSDADTYLVAGLHTGLATLYAWVWVTTVLVWTSRDNLMSMLDDAWPQRSTTLHPSSGLSPWVRVAAYAGALLAGAAVVVARGGLTLPEAGEALGIVVFLHGFGLLLGAIAAGLLSYPVVLAVRALQLGRRSPTPDARRARRGMLCLGLTLLLVLPASVCLALAFEPEGSDLDPVSLLGVDAADAAALRTSLLWVGCLLLVVMALLVVGYLGTRRSLGSTLAGGRRTPPTEGSLFDAPDHPVR